MKKKILAIILAVGLMLTVFLMPTTAAMPPGGNANYSAVDVSNNQGTINWQAVKGSVDATYIKATEGATYTDPYLAGNARGAAAAGIPLGFYHFFRLTQVNTKYVDAEAQAFYNAIKGYSYQLVPAVDVEVTDGQGKEVISSALQEFCRRFTALSGQPIIIYSYPTFINNELEPSLNVYPLWISHFTGADRPADTAVWDAWTAWQWTSDGSVVGITGRVDLDRATGGIFLSQAPSAPSQGLQVPKTVSGRSVAEIQAKLNRLKISSLAVDGINGPKTKAAVVTWEKINGLTPDGIWGPLCQGKYNLVVAKPTLRQGSTGYAVRYVQYRTGAKVDGKFGPKTAAAVRAYQRANGLQVDEIVGAKTWAKMIGG